MAQLIVDREVFAARPALGAGVESLLEGLASRLGKREHPAIVAGHYCVAPQLSELSHEGEAEAATFAFGLSLYEHWRQLGAEPELVLWVNDIGVLPDVRQRLKKNYCLPENYLELSAAAGVEPSRIQVFFESTIRNRASVLLRKLYRRVPEKFERLAAESNDLLRCTDDEQCEIPKKVGMTSYVVPGPKGERLVVKDGPNPKCNLILATLFQHLERRFESRVVVNLFNEVYAPRIALGEHVCRSVLGSEQEFVTLLCDGETLELA